MVDLVRVWVRVKLGQRKVLSSYWAAIGGRPSSERVRWSDGKTVRNKKVRIRKVRW